MTNGNGVHNNDKEVRTSTTEMLVYVFGAFGLVVAFSWMIIWAVLRYTEFE